MSKKMNDVVVDDDDDDDIDVAANDDDRWYTSLVCLACLVVFHSYIFTGQKTFTTSFAVINLPQSSRCVGL